MNFPHMLSIPSDIEQDGVRRVISASENPCVIPISTGRSLTLAESRNSRDDVARYVSMSTRTCPTYIYQKWASTTDGTRHNEVFL